MLLRTIFVFLCFFLVSISAKTQEPIFNGFPQWLNLELKEIRKSKLPVVVTKHMYKGTKVYVFKANACCDLGGSMRSEKGKTLCIFIGFVGRWENECRDFPKSGKLLRTVYEKN
ncbi:DUF6970 domain-containing protein [Shewanella atlantica]|uniref:DUF6970 domain-containing protein n=1 Tax=Shewanella atlantica TaxID=271099 RepID=A0A431WBS4_9GAMM|nr:hypothetical protein [Shewanella atlantica]RTR32921.1 hypothetical protein EKG39_11215 [Shewanella atlantica]